MKIFISVFVVFIALLLWGIHYQETVEMPKAFAAWEKQTGNEKCLTYDEWRSLVSANKKQNDTTLIFMGR